MNNLGKLCCIKIEAGEHDMYGSAPHLQQDLNIKLAVWNFEQWVETPTFNIPTSEEITLLTQIEQC